MRKENESCLQLKTGSCSGCSIQNMIIWRIRWKGGNPRSVISAIKKEYCPQNTTPQLTQFPNREASFAMGQERHENIHGLQNILRRSSDKNSLKST